MDPSFIGIKISQEVYILCGVCSELNMNLRVMNQKFLNDS
jgi:hypothetical protein